jgi:hypothetical protein
VCVCERENVCEWVGEREREKEHVAPNSTKGHTQGTHTRNTGKPVPMSTPFGAAACPGSAPALALDAAKRLAHTHQVGACR